MATTALSAEVSCMEQFRAAMPASVRNTETADRLLTIGQYRHLNQGEELPSNAREDRLVFIGTGVTKITAQFAATPLAPSPSPTTKVVSKTQILAFHFPGDIVSVLSEVDGGFRLVALQDAELVVFFADQFLDVAQTDPLVIRSVIANSIQALHASRTRMMQLGHKCAGKRIAEFLTSMAQRMCGCTTGPCEFALPMSRRDIADSLGLTLETVSRQFAELKEQGLIETQGRSIVRVNDLDALAYGGGCTPG
ncbi:MAG: helix-turn-helix domain-containing protein [Pseudomonadota bacterium]